MQSTQQFKITLPDETATAVKAKVAAGEYASESDVVGNGLGSLFARHRAQEEWLSTDVAAAYDELKADPSKARSVEQVRAILAAEAEEV